jgi:hypothetical protein
MEKEEFENISIMFNLRNNEYLSGNVHIRMAEYAKEIKKKQKEAELGIETPNISKVVADESDGDKQEKDDDKEATKQKDAEEALHRFMNFFIMSLKIPCYGKIPKKCDKSDKTHNFSEITNFYYYDVLEALARDVFLRWIQEEGYEIENELQK